MSRRFVFLWINLIPKVAKKSTDWTECVGYYLLARLKHVHSWGSLLSLFYFSLSFLLSFFLSLSHSLTHSLTHLLTYFECNQVRSFLIKKMFASDEVTNKLGQGFNPPCRWPFEWMLYTLLPFRGQNTFHFIQFSFLSLNHHLNDIYLAFISLLTCGWDSFASCF